jgi:hypothetical protein
MLMTGRWERWCWRLAVPSWEFCSCLCQSRTELEVRESILGIKKVDLKQVPYRLILKTHELRILVWRGFTYLYTTLTANMLAEIYSWVCILVWTLLRSLISKRNYFRNSDAHNHSVHMVVVMKWKTENHTNSDSDCGKGGALQGIVYLLVFLR